MKQVYGLQELATKYGVTPVLMSEVQRVSNYFIARRVAMYNPSTRELFALDGACLGVLEAF